MDRLVGRWQGGRLPDRWPLYSPWVEWKDKAREQMQMSLSEVVGRNWHLLHHCRRLTQSVCASIIRSVVQVEKLRCPRDQDRLGSGEAARSTSRPVQVHRLTYSLETSRMSLQVQHLELVGEKLLRLHLTSYFQHLHRT